MQSVTATAEVFWTAFKVLPQAEQQAFLRHVIKDETMRRDLVDLALIEERRDEPARPLRDFLAEIGE